MSKTNPSMYDGDRPCDKCGGPTLRVGAGSIWCPDESHPGGHFVVRVAFAQPPRREANGDWNRGSLPPKRGPQPKAAPRASLPTTKPVIATPVSDGFDTGMDGFVRSEK